MVLTPLFFLALSFYILPPVPAEGGFFCLPDAKLTPGHVFDVTAEDLCQSGYKSPARKVSILLKRRVYDRYGINGYKTGYNVDHLVPVKLGGSNSIDNLWPQPLSGEWCWYKKNKLERRLRKMVCRGQIDLKQAQQAIATDWVSAYKKYVGEHQKSWWR